MWICNEWLLIVLGRLNAKIDLVCVMFGIVIWFCCAGSYFTCVCSKCNHALFFLDWELLSCIPILCSEKDCMEKELGGGGILWRKLLVGCKRRMYCNTFAQYAFPKMLPLPLPITVAPSNYLHISLINTVFFKLWCEGCPASRFPISCYCIIKI